MRDNKPKNKSKSSFVPADRHDTLRHEIVSAIMERPLSAKEISGAVSIPEKAVYDHISHIQKSLSNKEQSLEIIPSKCRKCGFLFKKREKLKKPGRCPICRAETITEPLFHIKQ